MYIPPPGGPPMPEPTSRSFMPCSRPRISIASPAATSFFSELGSSLSPSPSLYILSLSLHSLSTLSLSLSLSPSPSLPLSLSLYVHLSLSLYTYMTVACSKSRLKYEHPLSTQVAVTLARRNITRNLPNNIIPTKP